MRYIGIIQETYKEKTLEVLQNHPYQLIEDIDGIGFKTADELALKLGGSKESPERLKAAVLYSVKRGCFDSGSTYMLYDEIKKAYHKQVCFSSFLLSIPCHFFDLFSLSTALGRIWYLFWNSLANDLLLANPLSSAI